jgi:hypothetical protein
VGNPKGHSEPNSAGHLEMNFSDKIVTIIPLDTLWSQETELNYKRVSYLTKTDIKDLLKQGQLSFIIADVGQKLKWIPPDQCFNLWKADFEKHIVTDINKICLDNFPDNYAYIASIWKVDNSTPVVLLEKTH